ncbi:PKD domain-containing protein [Candidatus Saccharibacteria bacterium]|nr:PKD domain-containing protein [Candidatus Saccharibacteria bacterium]
MKKVLLGSVIALLVGVAMPIMSVSAQDSRPQTNPSEQGIGMEGRIQQPAPTNAPTISLPSNGQTFTEIPITVTGLCQDGLLVRIFKNDVFAGATMCEGGSYTLQIDIFPGENELVAIQYDDLDQASPESNRVKVSFLIDVPTIPGSPSAVGARIILTSNYARRGVDPGKELVWPFAISGGRGPYAVSINWGDGKEELSTRDSAGVFDLKHIYDKPGIYKIIIKATDADGNSAFMQVIAVVNGDIVDTASALNEAPTVVRNKVLWQPSLIMFPLLLSSFWLGKRYQLKRVRYRMKHRIAPIDK